MKTYTIEIELKSDALVGSGEGFGAIIDSDIVFDDVGIPYVPAKRIKGCLRDAAKNVCEMLESAKIDNFLYLDRANNDKKEFKVIEKTFGKAGEKESAPIYFSNLTIEDYESNRQWLEYFAENYPFILSRGSILSTFTNVRQQTAIDDDGVVSEHSLRTIRVLKRGTIFKGEILALASDAANEKLLALACLNLRRFGTKRNRGFGEVGCTLFDESHAEVNILKELEALCKN